MKRNVPAGTGDETSLTDKLIGLSDYKPFAVSENVQTAALRWMAGREGRV